MLDPKERRNLKVSNKRLAIFLAIIFVFDCFIAFLFFKYTNLHSVLCGFIIIVITAILYLLFLLICAKIDKNKEKKRANRGKRDPFTHN